MTSERVSQNIFENLFSIVLGIIGEGFQAIAEKKNAERVFAVFWLCGPILFLWERTPADLWLSLIALAFLVKTILENNFSFMRFSWVRAIMVFWVVTILSGLFSVLPFYSVSEALIWLRFPLYAVACTVWLGSDPRVTRLFYFVLALGMLIMATINILNFLYLLTYENVYSWDGRLSWPYGDYFPGSYNSKFTLPLSLVAAAFLAQRWSSKNSVVALFLCFVMAGVLLTGERVNFLLLFCGCGMAFLFNKPKLLNFVIIFVLLALLLTLLTLVNPTIIKKFKHALTTFFGETSSNYHELVFNGWLIFTDNPILGVGAANFRPLCPNLVSSELIAGCNNHPHNFYIQLLAETGIIGFVAGILMVFFIIRNCWTYRKNSCLFSKTAFIVPLAFFYPFQTTSDFFSQWNNSVMWSAIGLALCAKNLNLSVSRTNRQQLFGN